MANLEQLQDLEIQRKGYLFTPSTNLDFIEGTSQYDGTIGYDNDPNLITKASTLVGGGAVDYKGRLKLWQTLVGTHYTSPFKGSEYIKVAMPGVANDMTGCWKKINTDDTTGAITTGAYTAYSVLAKQGSGDPVAITLGNDTILGKLGNGSIQAISIDTNLIDGVIAGSIPSAQAVVEYVNNQIAGALTFNGGYNVTADTVDSDPSKSLQADKDIGEGTTYPTISKGDTYVITTGGFFFRAATYPTSGSAGVTLGIGDMIIANKVDPRVLGDWTPVIKAIPNIADASVTTKGIIELATQSEVNTEQGTTGEPIEMTSTAYEVASTAVTPKTLAKRLYDFYTFLKTKFTGRYTQLLPNTDTGGDGI